MGVEGRGRGERGGQSATRRWERWARQAQGTRDSTALAEPVADGASQSENVSLESLDGGGGASQPLLGFLVKCKCAPASWGQTWLRTPAPPPAVSLGSSSPSCPTARPCPLAGPQQGREGYGRERDAQRQHEVPSLQAPGCESWDGSCW